MCCSVPPASSTTSARASASEPTVTLWIDAVHSGRCFFCAKPITEARKIGNTEPKVGLCDFSLPRFRDFPYLPSVNLVFLHGPAAAGKYTVARELAALTGFEL